MLLEQSLRYRLYEGRFPVDVDTLHRTNDGECNDCTRSYTSQCHRLGAYSTAFSAGRNIAKATVQLDAYELISD